MNCRVVIERVSSVATRLTVFPTTNKTTTDNGVERVRMYLFVPFNTNAVSLKCRSRKNK